MVSAADSVSPADFWAHYNIVIFTCVLVGSAGARKFHLGDYSPGGMGDGSSSVGSRDEAPIRDLGRIVRQKLKHFADIDYRFSNQIKSNLFATQSRISMNVT